jgi:hypothetical protein
MLLAIFAILLVLYFGLVDRWLRRTKYKPHRYAQPFANIFGAIVDVIRMIF